MSTDIIVTPSTPEESTLIGVKSVELNNAQILALQTTYIEILAAPGVGKANILLFATLQLDSTAGAYTNVDAAGTIIVVYGDYVGEASINGYLPVFEQAAKTIVVIPMSSGILNGVLSASSYTATDIENSSIKIAVTNGALGDVTGGNAANTLKATAYYIRVDL